MRAAKWSTLYVKFDGPKAGNSLEDGRLCGELKECVPTTARAKRFPLKKGKSTVIAEWKQFPLILAGLPVDLENLEKPGSSLCDLGNLENQGKFFENLENIFLTWNFPFNQNLKIKIVSFN